MEREAQVFVERLRRWVKNPWGSETEAFLRGVMAGKNEAALEAKYGSFDAKVQNDIAQARAEGRARAIEDIERTIVALDPPLSPPGETSRILNIIRAAAATTPQEPDVPGYRADVMEKPKDTERDGILYREGREAERARILAMLREPSEDLAEDICILFDEFYLPAWRACRNKHNSDRVHPAFAAWGPQFLRALAAKLEA